MRTEGGVRRWWNSVRLAKGSEEEGEAGMQGVRTGVGARGEAGTLAR